MVGATGFEPATPCAQGRCATRLRYAPTQRLYSASDASPATRQKRARPEDADDIALAHRDSIQSLGPRAYPPEVVADWQDGLTATLYRDAMEAGEVFFIATANVEGQNLVLGFASDYPIDGPKHGTSAYVRGCAARQGIGTALLRLTEAHAMVNGATSVHVEASLAAVEFYEASGFVAVGRGETHLKSGRPVACVFMRKDLNG